MAPGRSWHIPYISKYRRVRPDQCLHVVFLQRVSDDECDQIIENLKSVDEDWIGRLDVARPSARTLEARRWIRDYWPSSDAILEIARHAYSNDSDHEQSYRSLIFVDSGWEAGNVIVARWEGDGKDSRLKAVRVRMSIAEPLLSVCDLHEEYTLAQVLGNEVFEDARVDFYTDTKQTGDQETMASMDSYTLPEFLPQDLAINKTEPVILSLKTLDQPEIENLIQSIVKGYEADGGIPSIKFYNWHGSYVSRTEVRRMFERIRLNSDETNRQIPLFLVDALLEGPGGELQLVMVKESKDWRLQTAHILPVHTPKLLKLWEDATQGWIEENIQETDEYVDIWSNEYVFDLDVHKNFEEMTGAPVFYLQQFTLEEERLVRSKLRELSGIEVDENWGADWIYFGYLWQDQGQRHSMEDLRDLFESCDPFSPAFDPKRPGPYRLNNYPSNIIAVDERIFEPEPQIWLASSLDFSFDDVQDDLGWIYGLIPATEAHIAWVNLDVVNVGPEEQIDDPKRLWLSDLTESRRDYEALQDE